MKNIVYYIIVGVFFYIYRLIYGSYYGDIMGYVRAENVSNLAQTVLFLLPLLIYIIFAVIAMKIGFRYCIEWNKKSKIITVIVIIGINFLPITWLSDLILPYGFSKKY